MGLNFYPVMYNQIRGAPLSLYILVITLSSTQQCPNVNTHVVYILYMYVYVVYILYMYVYVVYILYMYVYVVYTNTVFPCFSVSKLRNLHHIWTIHIVSLIENFLFANQGMWNGCMFTNILKL